MGLTVGVAYIDRIVLGFLPTWIKFAEQAFV